MSPQDAAERKRQERARKREAGLQKFEFWLKPSEAAKVVGYIRRMRGHGYGLKKAKRLARV